jgi:hypothetical protein
MFLSGFAFLNGLPAKAGIAVRGAVAMHGTPRRDRKMLSPATLDGLLVRVV